MENILNCTPKMIGCCVGQPEASMNNAQANEHVMATKHADESQRIYYECMVNKDFFFGMAKNTPPP